MVNKSIPPSCSLPIVFRVATTLSLPPLSEMRAGILLGVFIWLSAALLATAQSSTNTLLSLLVSNGLSGFQDYINEYPALLKQIEGGNVTGMYSHHLMGETHGRT
jgi:hypothetical protein